MVGDLGGYGIDVLGAEVDVTETPGPVGPWRAARRLAVSTPVPVLSTTTASAQPGASWRRTPNPAYPLVLAVVLIDSLPGLTLSPYVSSTTLSLLARIPFPGPQAGPGGIAPTVREPPARTRPRMT